MNSYNNPFYKSLLGISEIDSVNSANINTQSLTVSSLGTGLVSSSSGTLQNAIIGTGLDYDSRSNTLSNQGVTSIISGSTGPVTLSNSTGNVIISLPQNIRPTSDVTFNSLTTNSFIQMNALIGSDGLMISGSGSLATLSELRAPLIYNPGTYSLRVALAGSTGINYTVRGNTGYISNTSVTGTTGPIGLIGPTGPIGFTGYTGPQGPPVPVNSSSVGELNITSASSALALTLQNTFYKITGWTVGTFNSGTTPSSTNSNIVINSSGIYQTLANISYIPGGNAHTFVFAVFQNGTQISGHQTSNMVNSINNVINNVTLTGVIQFAVGDIIDIRVQNITSAGTSITVQNANFNLCVQGGAQGPTGPQSLITSNFNVFGGVNSGVSRTTATGNVGLGYNSLSSLTSSLNNTAIGLDSLKTLSTNGLTQNGNNTAIGYASLAQCSTGFQNTAIGAFSGSTITTGRYNTLMGVSAGYNLTTGDTNFHLGLNSGFSNTTSNDNISIGAYSMARNLNQMTGADGRNVAIGHYSAYNLAFYPQNNISIGYNSMYNATQVSDNICIGTNAGNSITTGGGNISIGGSSLSTGGTLTNGQGLNIGLGLASNLYVASNAIGNIGIGGYSNLNTSTGANNISIGRFTQALSATGCNNIVISTNGVSGTPISAKGDNTAFIDARSGLYAYSPVIAQFTFINTNPQIAVNPNYLPYYSYGTAGTPSVQYFNRGITLTTNLNATIGGYWQFQQLGIYKITVSHNQFTSQLTGTTYVGKTPTLGSASITNCGTKPWSTNGYTNWAGWTLVTLVNVTNLTDYYFVSEYYGIAVNSNMNNNSSVLIEYVSVN